MVVVVSRAASGEVRASVEAVTDLKRLHAEFRGVGDAAAARALRAAGLGTVDGSHAWLSAAALRAAGEDSPGWTAQFDAMLSYAARQGWTDEAGSLVRAHISRC